MKQVFSWFFSLSVLILFLGNDKSFAAACCGGGFAAPSIIAGDEKAQLTTTVSNAEVVIDNVDSQGFWKKSDVHQNVQSIKIEAAHIFSDRYQAGLSIPVIQRTRDSQTYSGLGDLNTSVGYEYLPDWDYNPYRPKGIGFLQLTIPTGKSKADSEVGGLDSRGNGFWALGAGTLLTKTWTRLDAFFSFEIHRSFSKSVSNSQFDGKLNPAYGSNFGFGLGWNFSDFRFGSSLIWSYEDPIQTQSNFGTNYTGAIERFATAAISASYLVNPEWSGTINYTDQTLVGSPINTSLSKGITLQIQRRWGR